MDTKQMNAWKSNFGKEFMLRNTMTVEELDSTWVDNFGLSRTAMNASFINGLDRSLRILEVGCNIGNQLACLEKMGFNNLYGIDLFNDAVEVARNRGKFQVISGSAFDIPFKDDYFDLVFTSVVLIHISPEDIHKALDEIYRVSKSYLWGFEYFAEEFEAIDYRGNSDLLWRGNYPKLYTDRFALDVLKIEKYKYVKDNNVDVMYLLKKTA